MSLMKQFNQLDPINNGTTAQDNFKLSDAIPAQHTDLASGVNKLVHRTFAQSLCEPVAVCNSNNPQNGAYTATCQNYPDFALSYQDAQQNTQYLIGLKIRVIFTYGITYGSVSGGTYPTLNINGSGAIPMLAQGKTMATGAASAGQTLEFTVIPYGNGIAFDADSNVRESTSDYTIYTDGTTSYTKTGADYIFTRKLTFITANGNSFSGTEDYVFLKSLIDTVGTDKIIKFGYGWGTNRTVSFYNGNTEVCKIDTNGAAILIIFGNIRQGTWDALKYIMFGGFNNQGTRLNCTITGVMSYNGGNSLVRNAWVLNP